MKTFFEKIFFTRIAKEDVHMYSTDMNARIIIIIILTVKENQVHSLIGKCAFTPTLGVYIYLFTYLGTYLTLFFCNNLQRKKSNLQVKNKKNHLLSVLYFIIFSMYGAP